MIAPAIIRKNLTGITQQISQSAVASGRTEEDIQLIAVTKTVGIAECEALIELGVSHLAENRVNQAIDKLDAIGKRVSWHFIGHLQRNKVRHVVGSFSLIHSVDSLKLMTKIDEIAAKKKVIQNVLLEVNTSLESTKYGFKPDEILHNLKQFSLFNNVKILGLMTMAPFTNDTVRIRNCFKTLYSMAQEIKTKNVPFLSMDCLSMGMSNDYPIAIEEGATHIRVGTALFKS